MGIHWRKGWRLLVYLPPLMACGIVSALGDERAPIIRVALMDFAVDDNSYRSAQTAAAFSSLLQIEVANESGFEWVERAQLDRAKKELHLSEMDLLSGTADVRRGKWVKADWLVTGRFSLDDESRRLLFVEITDLHHADVLASDTVRLDGMATTPMNLASDQLPIASAALRRLFSEARKRADETAGKLVIAPLFFLDLRSYGPKEAFESLRSAFDNCLERLTGTNSRFRLIRFPKAYRAMDEAEMLVDGLVEWDSKSWESPGDLYIWGSYSMYSPFTVAITNGVRYEKHRTQQQLSFNVWDGVYPPLPVHFERVIPQVEDLGSKEAAPFWERLSKAIQEKASTQKLHAATGDVRREIADSLAQMFLKAPHRPAGPNDNSELIERTRLIETACFFDPDNRDAQALRICSRWGSWVDYSPSVKNQFLSKWRRSNAWTKYVERFDFGPVKADLHLSNEPYGIPGIYLSSLDEIVMMFPYGPTGLQESQTHGFPRDVPEWRIGEWETELLADLKERKSRVEAYLRARGNTNELTVNALRLRTPTVWSTSTTVANEVTMSSGSTVLRQPPPTWSSTNRLAAPASPPQVQLVPTNRLALHPSQTLPPGVRQAAPTSPRASRPQSGGPAQPWRRHLGEPNLFQLEPPNLWPVEVRPTITTIHFPAHFETKTILKIVPWRDELIMLVVDERSAPTSEPNPDIIEELLTKAGRLWKTQPGRTNATLLAARGMPESIYSFLVEKDRLWVSGKDFGYLDLNGSSFHRCQAGQGPEAPSDHALAASDGNLYTMRQSQIASFNPVSSKWTDLRRPARRRLEGEASASMAATEDWLCFGSSGAECCNLRSGLWTNVPGVSRVHCISEEKSGFWIGGDSGLLFYEPATGSLQSWQPPRKFPGLWDVYRPINLKRLAEAPGIGANGYPGFIGFANTLPSAQSSASPGFHYPKSTREAFGLDSHIAGQVRSCIKDGDRLWLGLAERLLLLDLPSRSLVACCRCGKPVVSIGVSDEFVWVGLAFGEQLLLQVPKRAFAAVPKNHWTPLTITVEERRHLIESMNVRDQAVYAFYGGDANRVVQLLKNVDPADATLEQMLLLAVSYDADETDSPEHVRAWCERIMDQYPGSPWGTFAQKAIDESQQNHSFRQHEKQLLAKFDQNHDDLLDAAEKEATKDDPEFKRIQRTLEEELLTPQIDVLIRRYDRDGDGKLGRRELENVKNQVRSLLNLGPENFPNNKLAPLITTDFPSVDTLLEKYDRNKDGALDASELRAFALDLRK